MKKTDPIKVEEFIRVDHAGERGAIKIYEGQLLALNTLIKDENLKKTIEAMKVHEKEHCDYFEKEIKKRKIKPTKMLPLWDLLGVGLGFGSTILGKKAAMLCTASVEEVIDKHYLNQLNQLESDEEELKEKAETNPLGRMTKPEEIADMAVFLCSNKASMVTGQVYHVNGGTYLP